MFGISYALNFVLYEFDKHYKHRGAIKNMVLIHSEKMLKSWIELNHYTKLLNDMRNELPEGELCDRAQAYIAKRKELGENAGFPEEDIAGIANMMMNFEIQEGNVKKAQTEIAFYKDVIDALKAI